VLFACCAVAVLVFALLKNVSKPPANVVEPPVTAPGPAAEPAIGNTTETTRTQPGNAPPRNDPNDPPLVRGRVRIEAGAPAPRAAVRLALVRGAETEALGETTTDAQGAFGFTSDALAHAFGTQATLRIDVDYAGYRPGQGQYALDQIARQSGLDAEIVLRSGAILSGRVVRASREPAGGAEVTLRVSRMTGAVESFVVVETTACAPDGTYRLAFESGGTYRVTARADGIGTGVVESVKLEAGLDTQAEEIVLAGGAPIAGRVVSESGAPIPFLELWAIDGNYANEPNPLGHAVMRVTADERDDGLSLAKGWTDAQGQFALVGLRPGHYALRAPDRGVVMEPRQGRFEPGKQDVRLVVSSHRLVVRVTDAHGTTARNAGVKLTELSTRIDGTYEASGTRTAPVNERQGVATFSLDPEAPVALVAFDGKRTSTEEIVMLAQNEWTREMSLVLTDASGKGRVRFDVLGEDGRPLTRLLVSAQSSVTRITRDELSELETDEHGVLDAVPAGTYHFLVGYAAGTSRDHFVVRTTEPVVVRANEEAIVPVKARRGGRLRVTLDARGALPAGYAESAKLAPEDRRDRFGVRVTLTPAAGGSGTALQFRPVQGAGLVGALLPGEVLVSDTLVERGAYDLTVESRAFTLANPLRVSIEPGVERDASVAVLAR
jgi:hypothetical protein